MAAVQPRQSAVLLWSEHSERCAQLRQMISDEQLRLFDKVCVDNDQIRSMICGSERLQIRFLPCFLIFDGQKNIIAKFEGDNALEWFVKNMQQKRPPQAAPPGPSHSRVDSILEGMRGLIPKTLETRDLPSHKTQGFNGPPLAGPQSRGPIDILRPREMHDIGRPMRSRPRGMIDDEEEVPNIPIGEDGYGQESFGKDPSGMGIANRGSERQYDDSQEYEQPEPPRMVAVGKGKNSIMVEDLTPNDEEELEFAMPEFGSDPSGMSIQRGEVPIAGSPPSKSTNADEIVQQMGKMGGRARQKQTAIKEAAATMAAARDAEMEQASQKRQASMQPQRTQGKRKAIRLDE